VGFSRTATKQDQFWQVVGDLEWKLDDGKGGGHPPDEPEFDHSGGGGGVWPRWATHVIAFLLGGLTWGSLLLAPIFLPVIALGAVIAFVAVAFKRRWR
jgi:hypothetical protein